MSLYLNSIFKQFYGKILNDVQIVLFFLYQIIFGIFPKAFITLYQCIRLYAGNFFKLTKIAITLFPFTLSHRISSTTTCWMWMSGGLLCSTSKMALTATGGEWPLSECPHLLHLFVLISYISIVSDWFVLSVFVSPTVIPPLIGQCPSNLLLLNPHSLILIIIPEIHSYCHGTICDTFYIVFGNAEPWCPCKLTSNVTTCNSYYNIL